MTRRFSTMVLAAVVAAVLCLQCAASAQQKTMLELKSKKGDRMQYTMTLGGTLNLDFTELPFPKSKMNIENLKAAGVANIYLETLDAADGAYTFDVKASVDRIILGDLIKLDGIGIKSTTMSPKITVTIVSTGKVKNIEMADLDKLGGGKGFGGKIPGLDMLGMGAGGFNDIITMAVGLLPSVLPDKEVAVGETWEQEINFDQMGMGAFLPRIPFKFRLLSLDGGIADIEVTTKGTFDGAFINNLLALIPEIPLGDDVLKISNVDLVVNWDGTGNMKLATGPGRIDEANMSTAFDVKLGAKTSFKHPDESNEAWNADGKIGLVVDMNLKYAGSPTAQDVNELFPADEVSTDNAKGAAEKAPVKKPAAKTPVKKKK